MTSQLKSADSKQIGEDFVPSFDSKTFDLQVPKLDHTMSRRVKEVKGGEAAKTEAKEKSLVSHQFKPGMIDEVPHILPCPGKEIIDTQHIVALTEQAFAQVRAQKPGGAGDQKV